MTTNKPLPEHDEVLDLMSVRAIEGLSDAEESKLARLLKGFEAEADELDAAAAALDVAWSPPAKDELPASLRRRILDDVGVAAARPTATPTPAPLAEVKRFPFEWLVAAAAVILAVVAWIPRLTDGTAPAEPNAAARLDALVAEATDVVRLPWAALDQPGFEKVAGEVVWSSERQEGYLRLAGLPDPKEKQYQLWIVDKDRDAKHPVDGGVIDYRPASPGAEVIVPIRAALDCPSPDVFALTLERAGGVVVSEGPLLVAASAAK